MARHGCQGFLNRCTAQAVNSRLILIGIANSIDLTERALPRLQATGARPRLVTFPSYSSLQLECLLQQRLAALPGSVFQPQAVRLAAKKARFSPFSPFYSVACQSSAGQTVHCLEVASQHLLVAQLHGALAL